VFCANIFRIKGEGFFRCGRLHFLVQKTSDFFKPSERTRERRVEPVWTFCGQVRRGQFFAILCGHDASYYCLPQSYQPHSLKHKIEGPKFTERANIFSSNEGFWRELKL